jgi:hypothetical protein
MRLQRAIKCIQHRNEIADKSLHSTPRFFLTITLRPLPEILEVGLPAHHGLYKLFLFGFELGDFSGRGIFISGLCIRRRGIAGILQRISVRIASHSVYGTHFFFSAFRFRHDD